MHTKRIQALLKWQVDVRGSMDHLIGAFSFQAAGANPNDVAYIPYDAGGKALAGLLSGETQINLYRFR